MRAYMECYNTNVGCYCTGLAGCEIREFSKLWVECCETINMWVYTNTLLPIFMCNFCRYNRKHECCDVYSSWLSEVRPQIECSLSHYLLFLMSVMYIWGLSDVGINCVVSFVNAGCVKSDYDSILFEVPFFRSCDA
ncbi:unnamed protein product [Camellia sinensis]